MRKLISTLVAAAGLLALTAAPSVAQDWPQKQTIRMIVPFPAGGGTDVVARIVAKYLGERLHQTVVVENRGGANGQIGLNALKQSAPDGYTIEVTSDTPMTVNPWIYKNISYDPLKDFIPVVSLIRLPSMLAVHPTASGPQRCRIHRAGEVEAGRYQLWIRRRWQLQSPGDGIILAGRGYKAGARSL